MKNNTFKTACFVGLRYLFSKKKHNVINVISIVSMVGIVVSAAALIVVLSVFNGMETFVRQSFNSFNPDYQILPAEGKTFSLDSFPMKELRSMQAVRNAYEVVSDMTLMTYGERQLLLSVKGVEEAYLQENGIDTLLIDGRAALMAGSERCAVMGAIAAGNVQLNLNGLEPLKVYYPKRMLKNYSNPTNAFNIDVLLPLGVFATYTDYDGQYVFVPIEFARNLMDYEREVTSVEVKLKNGKDYARWQPEIERLLGDKFVVKNKYQQEELLYKTMKSEKLIVFVILAFILLVAAFNIIGTLAMLIIEKKDDLMVFYAMGAKKSLVRRIFLVQGSFISMLGGIIGLILGAIVCFLQQTFHIIGLGDGSSGYLLDYYPVQMEFLDFLLVLLTIIVISVVTSYIPISYMKNVKSDKN